MKVGILALQGDFDAHRRALRELGVEACEVRTAEQLGAVEGLILPGGESTTMLKLLREEDLVDPLLEFAERKPLFGTCAGAILMAREVVSPEQESFGLLDICVERNAYGRQVHSSIRKIEPEEEFVRRSEPGPIEAVFIRAPIIRSIGEPVRVLARDGEDVVLVEQGRRMAATFHPELSNDRRIHKLFLEKISKG